MAKAEEIFEAACEELMEDPSNPEILANFQKAQKIWYTEACKALDHARTNRGFYPNRRPEQTGHGKRENQTRATSPFQGTCVRYGKQGHKARDCRQILQRKPRSETSNTVGFVGWNDMLTIEDDMISGVREKQDNGAMMTGM